MNQKPRRPFGVSLAILASVLLFTVIPMLQVGMILLVEHHFRNLDNTITLPSGETLEGFSGGDFRGGITDERLILQTVMGVGFLVVAALAWYGKPPQMRYVMLLSVLILTAISLGLTIIPSLLDESSPTSGGSLDSLIAPLRCFQLSITLLVPVYVVWYLNRAPARAFYRGYYLSEKSTAHSNHSLPDRAADTT